MPYIDVFNRCRLDDRLSQFASAISGPGELNYVVTRLLHEQAMGNLNYERLNGLIGVLECVKQEFYRTVVAPYEDKKKALNGPVSSLDA